MPIQPAEHRSQRETTENCSHRLPQAGFECKHTNPTSGAPLAMEEDETKRALVTTGGVRMKTCKSDLWSTTRKRRRRDIARYWLPQAGFACKHTNPTSGAPHAMEDNGTLRTMESTSRVRMETCKTDRWSTARKERRRNIVRQGNHERGNHSEEKCSFEQARGAR